MFGAGLSREANALENTNKICDQAFQNYMKLSKKSPYRGIHSALSELAVARRDFEREACVHYGHLNEAGYLREIAPMLSISLLLDSQTQHVQALNQVFGGTLATYLTAAQAGLRRRVQTQEDNALLFRSHVNNLEFEPLSKFCPEPRLLDSDLNAELSIQSPTPPNFSPKPVGCYCAHERPYYHAGLKSTVSLSPAISCPSSMARCLGASLLIDLNQKGVYAEVADCDDRRNVFQIVSPTEHNAVEKSAQMRIEPLDFLTTIGAAHMKIVTGSRMPDFSKRWSSRSTRGNAAYDTVCSGQKTGVAFGRSSNDAWAQLQRPRATWRDISVLSELDNTELHTELMGTSSSPNGSSQSIPIRLRWVCVTKQSPTIDFSLKMTVQATLPSSCRDPPQTLVAVSVVGWRVGRPKNCRRRREMMVMSDTVSIWRRTGWFLMYTDKSSMGGCVYFERDE
ncbi:unnamed protein product [Echinostoma caproni]|uniref:BAR domain-containing protein n=1 Tax=Echinostoma caproni TaxID=27848 RepID=A0A183ASW4_9TREM|nr:unnamed protein product [Echinostoma caproni]